MQSHRHCDHDHGPSAPSTEVAIRLEGVSVSRGGSSVLADITADVPRGGVTALIGPNGAGKTTLLSAMLGLLPYRGVIDYRRLARGSGNGSPEPNATSEGGRRRGRKPRIGYVPQRLDFDRSAPLTVLDFLVLAGQRMPLWFGVVAARREKARRCLTAVDADHLLERPLGGLSGGELQRVQLALALEAEPDILLLDEPVSGVDIQGERLFCDILEQVQRDRHLTVVMVSHDLSVVSRHASYVLCLNRRLLCAAPPSEALSEANLHTIFGAHMGLFHHAPPQAVVRSLAEGE